MKIYGRIVPILIIVLMALPKVGVAQEDPTVELTQVSSLQTGDVVVSVILDSVTAVEDTRGSDVPELYGEVSIGQTQQGQPYILRNKLGPDAYQGDVANGWVFSRVVSFGQQVQGNIAVWDQDGGDMFTNGDDDLFDIQSFTKHIEDTNDLNTEREHRTVDYRLVADPANCNVSFSAQGSAQTIAQSPCGLSILFIGESEEESAIVFLRIVVDPVIPCNLDQYEVQFTFDEIEVEVSDEDGDELLATYLLQEKTYDNQRGVADAATHFFENIPQGTLLPSVMFTRIVIPLHNNTEGIWYGYQLTEMDSDTDIKSTVATMNTVIKQAGEGISFVSTLFGGEAVASMVSQIASGAGAISSLISEFVGWFLENEQISDPIKQYLTASQLCESRGKTLQFDRTHESGSDFVYKTTVSVSVVSR